MKTLIVASTRPYSGKSGICVALLSILSERGVRAGYFKPYGTMPVTVDDVLTDQDAAYVVRHASAAVPLAAVCPVVGSRALVEEVLAHDPGGYPGRMSNAFAAASADAEVMVVEGTSDLSQARTLGLNLCAIADSLDASVLLVDRPEGADLPDTVLWASDCLGDRLAGVVFNAVRDHAFDFVAHASAGFLVSRGIPVFGVMPHDPLLSSVTVAEIVDALSGTVLCAEDHLDDPVERFMVGAMGQDKALRYFRRRAHKAVITGGDRADVQLAALETDTRCVILTGDLQPSGLVVSRAEELGVPMVLVAMDTLTAVEKMESLLGRVRLHDPAKAARMREMFAASVDSGALLAATLGV